MIPFNALLQAGQANDNAVARVLEQQMRQQEMLQEIEDRRIARQLQQQTMQMNREDRIAEREDEMNWRTSQLENQRQVAKENRQMQLEDRADERNWRSSQLADERSYQNMRDELQNTRADQRLLAAEGREDKRYAQRQGLQDASAVKATELRNAMSMGSEENIMSALMALPEGASVQDQINALNDQIYTVLQSVPTEYQNIVARQLAVYQKNPQALLQKAAQMRLKMQFDDIQKQMADFKLKQLQEEEELRAQFKTPQRR